jgi:hypothetical protein
MPDYLIANGYAVFLLEPRFMPLVGTRWRFPLVTALFTPGVLNPTGRQRSWTASPPPKSR